MTKISILLCIVFIFSNCHSSSKKTDSPLSSQSQKPAEPPPLTLLTGTGDNLMPRYSKDGSHIIFISQNRGSHKNGQVYILNLKDNKERRITFNDGDDFYPSFDSSGRHILYASTTDEKKEHPSLSVQENIFDPHALIDGRSAFEEIYKSESDGSHIVRLTQSPDFDGTPDFSPDGSRIVFTSKRTGEFKIFIMDAAGKGPLSLSTGSKDLEISPRFSPSGKHLIWIRKIADGSQVIMGDVYGHHTQEITTHDAINRDADFSSDKKKIIFSSNRENKNIFSLYVANLDGSCPTKISPSAKDSKGFSDVFPQFSPDDKKIIFSSNRSGKYQIYMMDFTPPADCHPTKM